MVQRNAHSCSDRASTISSISYRLRLQPPGQRVAIVFGGFENFATGTRSSVQLAPLDVLKTELSDYVRMIMDIMALYPLVNVFILPPLYRDLPAWFASSYESFMPRFLSDVCNVDPLRVKVVPPVLATSQDLEFDGIHLKPALLQRLLDVLLVSFRDGDFVKPDDYPLSEDLSKLLAAFYFRCFQEVFAQLIFTFCLSFPL